MGRLRVALLESVTAHSRFDTALFRKTSWAFGTPSSGTPSSLSRSQQTSRLPVLPDSRIHWTAYPALLLAGAMAAGVALAWTAAPPVGAWWALAACGLATWTGAEWRRAQRLVTLSPLTRTVALALLAVAAGGLRTAVYTTAPTHAIHRVASPVLLAGDTTTVTGVVAGAPSRDAGVQRFTLSTRTWHAFDGSREVSGRVRVTLRSSAWDDDPAPFPTVRQGDRIRIHGRLRSPPPPRNPADFDYAGYLARRDIHATLRSSDSAHVTVIERGNAAQRALSGARSYVRHRIAADLPSAEAQAVLQALLLGDRSRVSDDHRQAFAQTGLMHLLAVSGLHVLLVGMLLYGLLRPLLLRFRWKRHVVELTRATLTIAVLVFYMLLTGGRPSVVRAVVMAALLIGGLVLQRSSHTLNTLGVAAVVLLAMRPTALFDAGFQLSLSAVAGIVVLNPRLADAVNLVLPSPEERHPMVSWTASMITVSTAATLGTAPPLLYHFGFVAVGGLILNVVAIPLTAVALTSGLLAMLAGGLFPIAGAAFGAAADATIRLLVATATTGATWLGVGVHALDPSTWLLLALVVALGVIAQWPRPRTRWRLCIALLGVLSTGLLTGLVRDTGEPVLEALFLDVGQGDAALLTTPDGRTLLVDAGPRSPVFDAGERIVVPHLEYAGIDRIDVAVVTHPDSDHLGGLPAVLRHVPVNLVLHSGQASGSELFNESRRVMDSLDVSHRAVTSGDVIDLGDHVSVEVLAPPTPDDRARLDGENDASVVLRVQYGDTRILLTGDIERGGEHWLAQRYGSTLASDIVKVAHHGSLTSSTPALLAEVTADSLRSAAAVVSAGRYNRFGHPAPEVLSRWQSRGSLVLRTDRLGAIRFETDGRCLRFFTRDRSSECL